MYKYITIHSESAAHFTVVSLKLLANQIAVSLGETFSGPNGFSNTPSSSNLCCCRSRALNSSNPSNASARCWYDEVSNRNCRDSKDKQLATSPLWLCSAWWALSRIWTVHLSLVIEWTVSGEADEHWGDVEEVLGMGKRESSGDVKGNSAILSNRGALTETSGDWILWRRPALVLYGVAEAKDVADNGRETLRDSWEAFLGFRDCKYYKFLEHVRSNKEIVRLMNKL